MTPDCPFCDAKDTLEKCGVAWVCSCCARVVTQPAQS